MFRTKYNQLFCASLLSFILGVCIVVPCAEAGPTPYTLDSIATFQFGNDDGSDCWGWISPSGDQYAIMGTEVGLVFVNVSTLQVADTLAGSSCGTQDMATVGHYCYLVSECGFGLQVIDLQYLPDSVHLVSVLPTDGLSNMWCHNLTIDSLQNFLYVQGRGPDPYSVHMHDISDKENPVFIGGFGTAGAHDFYVSNDTAYVAEGSDYFSIWDLTSKLLPRWIAKVVIPGGGPVHNIWPSDDRSFLITTEEEVNRTIKIWDIKDFENIRLVGEILGPSEMAHNVRLRGNTAFVSHYFAGVFVFDVSIPHCPTELASFDTWTGSESFPFSGSWGIFPFTKDSLVYSSNSDGRLHILRLRKDNSYISTEPDSDGDSVGDGCDNCPLVANADQADIDFDGTGDDCDNCPSDPNAEQEDFDGDGVGDACDVCAAGDDNLDSDVDNVADACDNCPNNANENQVDSDADGIGNLCDNCPDDANAGQSDRDSDGNGDLCDICPDDPNNDIDGDLVCGDIDNCPSTPNPSQADANDDEIGDACCCIGAVGNIDASEDDIVDIGDLTMLIDFLFISYSPLACSDEANVDGSADSTIDIGDLTALIDFLFITLTELRECE